MFRNWKRSWLSVFLLSLIISVGYAFGAAKKPTAWKVIINGKPSSVRLYLIKNSLFVTLNDLAKLPGWKVLMDLGEQKISLTTPKKMLTKWAAKMTGAGKRKPSPAKSKETAGQPDNQQDAPSQPDAQPTGLSPSLELSEKNQGPPNNVRMTVEAALSTLDELQKALESDLPLDTVKAKKEETKGIVDQAQNLLSSFPRTNTIQADLQVVQDDLQSEINLAIAASQVKQNILPWTHPAAQALLLKYPDLRPCHVTQDNTEGLDAACSRKVLAQIAREDFDDVHHDVNQYH